MGEQYDKHLAKRRADRVEDPHKWAEQIEDEISARAWVPLLALLISLAAGASTYVMWKDRDRMEMRIRILEQIVTPTEPDP